MYMFLIRKRNYLLVHVLSDSSLTFDSNLMLEDMFGISGNEWKLVRYMYLNSLKYLFLQFHLYAKATNQVETMVTIAKTMADEAGSMAWILQYNQIGIDETIKAFP